MRERHTHTVKREGARDGVQRLVRQRERHRVKREGDRVQRRESNGHRDKREGARDGVQRLVTERERHRVKREGDRDKSPGTCVRERRSRESRDSQMRKQGKERWRERSEQMDTGTVQQLGWEGEICLLVHSHDAGCANA